MHEYQRRLNRALRNGVIKLGTLGIAQVTHDNWCGIYKHKECDCDPDITIETEKGMAKICKDGFIRPIGWEN